MTELPSTASDFQEERDNLPGISSTLGTSSEVEDPHYEVTNVQHFFVPYLFVIVQKGGGDDSSTTLEQLAQDQIKNVPKFLIKVRHQLNANGHALSSEGKRALQVSMEDVRRVFEEHQQQDNDDERQKELTIKLLEHMLNLSELYIKFVRLLDTKDMKTSA